jgi:hypothetical protein
MSDPQITEEMIQAAAEAMEDAAVELIGRDLGTIHRNRIAERGLRAALAGRAVLALPESDQGVFRPSARTVVAKVDHEGRPFVRIDGAIWLDGEAEDVGLAMVAAAHEARQAASVSSKGGEPR